MKTQALRQMIAGCAIALIAFGCQPKQKTQPPVAPPQAYESESCTDPDECSEGAATEAIQEEQVAPAVQVEAAPVNEAVAEPATAEPTAEAPKVEAAPAVTEAMAPEVIEIEVLEETASAPAITEVAE